MWGNSTATNNDNDRVDYRVGPSARCVCAADWTTAAGSPANLPLIPTNEGNRLLTGERVDGVKGAEGGPDSRSAPRTLAPSRPPPSKRFQVWKASVRLCVFTGEARQRRQLSERLGETLFPRREQRRKADRFIHITNTLTGEEKSVRSGEQKQWRLDSCP